MNSPLFIVVLVENEWYRIQTNLAACDSIDKAKERGARLHPDLPITDDQNQSKAWSKNDTNHIWIQSLPLE